MTDAKPCSHRPGQQGSVFDRWERKLTCHGLRLVSWNLRGLNAAASAKKQSLQDVSETMEWDIVLAQEYVIGCSTLATHTGDNDVTDDTDSTRQWVCITGCFT